MDDQRFSSLGFWLICLCLLGFVKPAEAETCPSCESSESPEKIQINGEIYEPGEELNFDLEGPPLGNLTLKAIEGACCIQIEYSPLLVRRHGGSGEKARGFEKSVVAPFFEGIRLVTTTVDAKSVLEFESFRVHEDILIIDVATEVIGGSWDSKEESLPSQ